jgi:hypothetical protein
MIASWFRPSAGLVLRRVRGKTSGGNTRVSLETEIEFTTVTCD